MGGSCGCCRGSPAKEEEQFQQGGENDLSNGPVQNRGCTDIVCIPLYLAAQVLFIIVTIVGFEDGDPSKLYKPRDFRGAYCGVEENWNGGPSTFDMPVLSYTMNVSNTVDVVMKQMVCSSMTRKVLVDGDQGLGIAPILDTSQAEDYLCDCCLKPCAKCSGSLEKGEDLTTGSLLEQMISGRMGELTNWDKGAQLMSANGFNGDTFSTDAFWSSASKHFNTVCLPSCDSTNKTGNKASNGMRSYTYSPAADDDLRTPWKALVQADSNSITSKILQVVQDSFTFDALPSSICPYEPVYCVPMPGVQFAELGAKYCTFDMAAEVVEELGDAAADAFESLGGASLTDSATESFGKFVGDFQETLDTFAIVSVLSFVSGLVFLVVLRYTIKICVWTAIVLTVLLFLLGGFLVNVLSGQCRGVTVFVSGRQAAFAIFVKTKTTVSNTVTGREPVDESMADGLFGTDYRGHQHRTRTGRVCSKWDEQDVMPEYNSTFYPDAGIEGNHYCRNPWNNETTNNARTIWCITADTEKPWDECDPVGMIRPVCHDGHEISSESMRKFLLYVSFVIWGLGALWILIIICLRTRIKLAIALNQVAAVFLASNPSVLLVPVSQALTAIIWTVVWCLCASFLLSQVPDGYTPKGYYETYTEAYGTSGTCAFWEFSGECAGTPGMCTGSWPTGRVWKDDVCQMEGGVAKCWRCAPPRYMIDWRFAGSFFVFLWNNAFNVALGQIIIAMCVGLWFFSENRGRSPVIRSSLIIPATKTIFRYHLGSVAFGSLIVAIVQFIRYVMMYFEKQAEAQKNRLMVYILKCMQCCIWCFEKIIKFLNKNAYIQIALMGKNFCTSARKAFFLILRNAARFGTVAALGGIIHGIGVIFIMASTLVIGYFLSREMHPDIEPFMPMMCFGTAGYVVARLYMNVFGLAVDTSLQCFLAVEEMGVGGEFVPQCLRDLVEKH